MFSFKQFPLVVLLLLTPAAVRAADMTTALTPADLDLAASSSFINGKVLDPAPADALPVLLGLQPPNGAMPDWKAGPVLGTIIDFRVDFKQPIQLGTVITSFKGGQDAGGPVPRSGQNVAYLKPTAAYPGDVTKDDDWVVMTPGVLKTLPPGVSTRALRFHDRVGEWGYGAGGDRATSRMPSTLLFKERYFSALNIGTSQRSGKANTPEVWMGYWTQPEPIAGLVFLSLQSSAELDYLKPDTQEHPILAAAKSWKHSTPIAPTPGSTIVRFDQPITTRAIRLTAPSWRADGNFPNVIPLVDLGANVDIPGAAFPPPPFSIKYDMPMDGFVALNVYDKKTGERVKQLIAEVARGKGMVDEPWDLKDEKGAVVPPGDYEFKMVARPPLKLTYELTPYNAGQPPWWAPVRGGGGWMADHTPPYSAVAYKDLIFLSSTYNESGSGIIAVDHEGNKVWGEPYVTGFEIANHLVTDGKYVYAINRSTVHRVDPEDKFSSEDIGALDFTRELPMGNISPTEGGAAAHDGKLYLSYSGPVVPWLQPSFLTDDLSPDKSFPRVWLARGEGRRAGFYDKDLHYSQEQYDEIQAFYSAFLAGTTPAKTTTWPSTGVPSSTQGYFGDAPKEGPLMGTLIAAFTKPVTVGSVFVSDKNVKVWALKPGAAPPADDPGGMGNDPDAGTDTALGAGTLNDDDWIPLEQTGKAGQASVATAPTGGIQTRALRFKTNRLAFALVTARRFDDLSSTADRVYSEGGSGTAAGAWMLNRANGRPVSRYSPASMALVWKEPVTLRGVTLVRPAAGVMAVDVFTGPDSADPAAALEDDKQWKEMGRFTPEIFYGWFAQTPAVKSVDFGDLMKVRAIRVRALSGPVQRTDIVGAVWQPTEPVLNGIIAAHYLAGDPAGLPQDLSNRIDVYQLPTDPKGRITPLNHIPLAKPAHMIFDRDGTMLAESNGRVVTVPLDGKGESRVVVPAAELDQPSDMTMDAAGLLYVSDMGPQVVKVFDPKTGKLVRTIGKPGGNKLGPWDDQYMDRPTGITIDSAGKLWIAHNSYQPKRVSRWSLDGQCEANFMGPTQYGGGGTLDDGDKSLINYNGMQFKIDWAKMDWKLDSILFRPGPGMSPHFSNPDHPVYYKGKRYLVGNSGGSGPLPLVVCIEKDGIAVPAAACGNLGSWSDIGERPDLMKAFGSLDRAKFGFVWYDKNGDGIPEADEVQVIEGKLPASTGAVGEDLSFNFAGARLRPTGILPNGVPSYDIAKYEDLPLMSERSWALPDGRTFEIVNQYDKLLAPDGKTVLWSYYDEFGIFGGWYASNWGYDRPPGKLNAEQSIFGHMNGPGKEEFWITSSDQGDWFCFTGDGFLVGCIFGGPAGYGLRRWTMPDYTPGKVDLSDLRMLQETYEGDVVRAEDGNVYAVAGKNHMSIVKVDGLEKMERLAGTFSVTPDDIQKMQAWALRKASQEQTHQEAKIAKVPFITDPVVVDGALDDWPYDLFFTIQDFHKIGFHEDEWITQAQGAFAYDDKNLYVAAKVLDDSPMMNSSEDPKVLFKHGDALDIQLGLDPNGDPKRTSPVAGDVRILASRVKGQPVVMLYKYKDPAAPVDQRVHFTSPVGETWVDSVKQLDDAKLGIQTDKTGWTMEVAIPWKDLGVDPPKIGSHIKGDIGVLQSDQNGVQTVNRLYWSGKSQRVVADLPSEARLAPPLWGDLYFTEPAEGQRFGPADGGGDAPDLAP